MKRRLLSAFLAVMMVLTMAPVAFAADGVEPTDGTGSSEAAPAKTPQQQIDGIRNRHSYLGSGLYRGYYDSAGSEHYA